MNNCKQLQKAGDGANQYQANTIIIQNGIDEKRAREIYNEMFAVTRRDLSAEAYDVACHRVNEFENDLIPKMQRIDGALEAFADPAFQFLITNAHKTAASTDRPADYSLLSELLIHRIQRGENRSTAAGISRAVEIVDKISDDALLALSVAFAVQQYAPVSGHISQGLNVLDNLFSKLFYSELPAGSEWLDHLDILDAIRVSTFGNLKKFEDYYASKLSGYCVAGIRVGSENHSKAKELLESVELTNILVPNELDANFLRIPVVTENSIEDLSITKLLTVEGNTFPTIVKLSDLQKDTLHKVYALYEHDKSTLDKIKKDFLEELLKHQHLNVLRNWWNQIPLSFSITAVGKVLAHANAKRCDNSLPDLN